MSLCCPLLPLGGVITDWDVASTTHDFRAHTRHGELEVMRAGLYHLYAQVQVRFSDSADSAWQELQVDDVTMARCPLTSASAVGAPGGGHPHPHHPHPHHHHPHHHHLSTCYTARALALTPHQKVRVRVTLAGGGGGVGGVASEGGGAAAVAPPPSEVGRGGPRAVVVHMDPEATFYGAVRLGDAAT
ncbi:ectodysplasin-A-like [Petromyzon marinus]|uniref:ectodysplasin-A-like n=1 Tax=Petromyzon marinus TaxID=7757 RepID=UPI003F6E88B3